MELSTTSGIRAWFHRPGDLRIPYSKTRGQVEKKNIFFAMIQILHSISIPINIKNKNRSGSYRSVCVHTFEQALSLWFRKDECLTQPLRGSVLLCHSYTREKRKGDLPEVRLKPAGRESVRDKTSRSGTQESSSSTSSSSTGTKLSRL